MELQLVSDASVHDDRVALENASRHIRAPVIKQLDRNQLPQCARVAANHDQVLVCRTLNDDVPENSQYSLD